MIVNSDVHVVEDVVVVSSGEVSADHTSILGVTLLINITTHGEASAAVVLTILHRVAPRDGHVVDDPVVLVVHEHPLPQQSYLLLVVLVACLVLLAAQHLALRVLTKLDLVWRGSDPLSKHHLSKILCG